MSQCQAVQRCTRERIGLILEGFGTDDLDHMTENGAITVTCEFCNVDFRFRRGDVGRGGAAG